MLSRRSFLLAAPAIVAASTLMPVSSRFVAPLLMPWQYTVLYRIHGWDEHHNRISAVLRDPGKADRFVASHGRAFKLITNIVVL